MNDLRDLLDVAAPKGRPVDIDAIRTRANHRRRRRRQARVVGTTGVFVLVMAAVSIAVTARMSARKVDVDGAPTTVPTFGLGRSGYSPSTTLLAGLNGVVSVDVT